MPIYKSDNPSSVPIAFSYSWYIFCFKDAEAFSVYVIATISDGFVPEIIKYTILATIVDVFPEPAQAIIWTFFSVVNIALC